MHYPPPGPLEENAADVGIVGTTDDVSYPGRSPWAIFELNSITITPSNGSSSLEGVDVVVVVEAWDNEGRWTGSHSEPLTAGEPRLEVCRVSSR